ncbi:SAF domain-containing protein [Streptomyces triticagri]|uniref:SAF domain-containing protein n=1 Tax=Streptomyces triticagri TaxID=2293568 RepID=UPI001314603E|nr:SAF domain-containing protein [Streptomyces triticagri]
MLTVVRPVAAGDVIEAKDVGVVQLGVDDATQVVPAGERSSVVGRRAVVPLVAGQMVARGHVGDTAQFPPEGRALVVVGVAAESMPAGLAAGQRVAVVPGAGPESRALQEGEKAPDPVLGVVNAVSRPESASGKGAVTVLTDAGAVLRTAQLSDPRIAVLSDSVQEVS